MPTVQFTVTVAVIATPRLELRPHGAADFDDCAAMWGDAEVTRYIGGRPFTREETWTKILRYAGLWSLLGYGYWAVRERASGRFVGDVGLADFKRDIEPPFGDAAEAGWVLATGCHGKGFATEAVRAALDWYAKRSGGARTVCLIDPQNAASIHVAQKCGYVERARTTYKGGPAVVFERPARGS